MSHRSTTRPRFLLVQQRWLGDVLLCTPAIRAVRRAFPDATIDFMTEPPGAEILRNNPHVDNVLVESGTRRSRLLLFARVALRSYKAVIDFRSTLSTAQLTFVSRAAIRVGIRGRGPRNRAYTHTVEKIPFGTYVARYRLDMLSPLGIRFEQTADLSLDLPVGPAARVRASALWDRFGLQGSPVVAVSATARADRKQWGAERWAAVADAIADEGARVLLTRGPGEADQVHRVVDAMRITPVWDFPQTSLEELAAILDRCTLWVGNDGGAKHVAVAVDTPTVAVSRWQHGSIWTDGDAPVAHTYIDRAGPPTCDLDCFDCPEQGCLASLEPADVIDRVRSVLAGVVDGRNRMDGPPSRP